MKSLEAFHDFSLEKAWAVQNSGKLNAGNRSKLETEVEVDIEMHTEWFRNPAMGIKQVLSPPSANWIFMLLEYQSSHAHR